MLLPAITLWVLAPEAHACDTKLLEMTRADLAAPKGEDFKLRKLAGSLAESCRFSPALTDALAYVPSAQPSGRGRLEQKAVTGDAAGWTAACAGGSATFDAAFAATGQARAAALYGPCDLQRYKFATESELADATGLVFLAVMVAQHFESKAVTSDLAIPLLRGLAGLPPQAAAAAAPSAAPSEPALPAGAPP
jgi:hypothetical protein